MSNVLLFRVVATFNHFEQEIKRTGERNRAVPEHWLDTSSCESQQGGYTEELPGARKGLSGDSNSHHPQEQLPVDHQAMRVQKPAVTLKKCKQFYQHGAGRQQFYESQKRREWSGILTWGLTLPTI
ncbi:hypothetical protein RRG08_037962 [Elysia crispata]|uniref:Uncharacterized protein n=1 Tax=Elysia crispata TaxID=231223 RepID=A0AAE1DWK0_9GAST|nr:hypothetical protein RRG08_037962 [Elysia crispata]